MQTAKRLGLKEQIELVIFQTIREFGEVESIVAVDGLINNVEEILADEKDTPSHKYKRAADRITRSLDRNHHLIIEDRYTKPQINQLGKLRNLLTDAHSAAFDSEVYTDKERLTFLLRQVDVEREIRNNLDASWSDTVLSKFAGYADSLSSIVDQRAMYNDRIKKMESEIGKLFRSYPEDVQKKFANDFLDMKRQEKLDVN